MCGIQTDNCSSIDKLYGGQSGVKQHDAKGLFPYLQHGPESPRSGGRGALGLILL